MMATRTRIQVLFNTPLSVLLSDPRKKLVELVPELLKLRTYLRRGIDIRETLPAIVDFFDVVSRWHDRGLQDVIAPLLAVNYSQYDEVIAKLRQLEGHFQRAGRDESGMNRTKPGEMVRASQVFLGNVYGLFTHPIPFWVERRDETKGVHPDFPTMNAYDLVCAQARRFMTSHMGPMVGLIDDLVRLAGYGH
jgi:hypothetical protein